MNLRTFSDCRSVLSDPQIPFLNKLPYHAPVIPEDEACHLLLSGEWDFAFFSSVKDVPEDPTHAPVSTKIPVPSNWALHGFDIPRYINTRFGWEPDVSRLHPPFIPEEGNSAGLYRTTFTLPEPFQGRRTILSFEGAESGLFVYVNGRFAGYSANGRSAADFDVTNYVQQGENQLDAVVTLWSSQSWMECQDMWRLGGIIRDVRLYSVPNVSICDYYAWTRFEQGYRKAFLELEVKIRNQTDSIIPPCKVLARIYDGEDLIAEGEGICGNTSFRYHEESMGIVQGSIPSLQAGCTGTAYLEIPVDNPALWSAEIPHLYSVRLELLDGETVTETLSFRHGFREIVHEGASIRINGKEVLFRGVNRHEFSPTGGHVVTYDEMLKDILLMKRSNVNAVRSSHYPNCQTWYDLCDEYGLYVMDEANVETHGLSYRRNLLPGNDALWYQGYLDRIASMVQCDKNHASIVIWSLGNELGFGENVAFGASYCRSYDPTRLIHKRQMHCIADMDSETYPTPADMLLRTRQFPDRPYLCNEYGHAMGNAMGSLSEYWHLFRTVPQLKGGFIWEWCDHGLLTDKGFIYGGDSGEAFHDGNFCIDGLVTPDRKVTPKLKELKKVHEFIQLSMPAPNFILVENEYAFLPLDGFKLRLRLLEDGTSIWDQTIPLVDIEPGSRTRLKLHLPQVKAKSGAEYVLDVKAVYAEDTPFCDAGYEAAHLSQPLPEFHLPAPVFRAPSETPVISETGDRLTVSSSVMQLDFDRTTGRIASFVLNGTPLFCDLVPSFFRAPTDNDVRSSFVRGDVNWYSAGLKNPEFKLVSLKAAAQYKAVRVTAEHSMAGIHLVLTYTIFSDGRMLLTEETTINPEVPILPRIGLRITADPALQQSVWYGFGQETYPDRKACGTLKRYEKPVANGHENYYVRPQEYDDHMECRIFALRGEHGGFAVFGSRPLSMKAIPYTSEQLDDADHIWELPESKNVYLYADAHVTGLGNASCGAEVFPPYQVVPGHYRYSLTLVPFAPDADPVALKNAVDPPEYAPEPDLSEPLPGLYRERLYHRYRDPSDPDIRASLGYV